LQAHSVQSSTQRPTRLSADAIVASVLTLFSLVRAWVLAPRVTRPGFGDV